MFSGQALARIRKKQGFSQEGLARAGSRATVTIAKLEGGRNSDPRASTLLKLAKALDCKLEELVNPILESTATDPPGQRQNR